MPKAVVLAMPPPSRSSSETPALIVADPNAVVDAIPALAAVSGPTINGSPVSVPISALPMPNHVPVRVRVCATAAPTD